MEYHEVEILMVEDNPDDAELALRAFRKNNIANRIVHLKDGEEAVDFIFAKNKYSSRNPDDLPKMILLDLKLPKMDGLEVLEVLKSNEKTKRIPVIMLTSSKEEKDIVKSYSLGVNSYIVKPVDFEQFVLSVKDIGYYWLLLNQNPIDIGI